MSDFGDCYATNDEVFPCDMTSAGTEVVDTSIPMPYSIDFTWSRSNLAAFYFSLKIA